MPRTHMTAGSLAVRPPPLVFAAAIVLVSRMCTGAPAFCPDRPPVGNAMRPDAALEARVAKLLATMTLDEKIGQMTQVEIQQVTPDEVRQYHLGSVLSGGGSWPKHDKRAGLREWVALADRLWEASMDESDGHAAIPLIWGTDAVHGHNNVSGATLFPHNIGLGAAHDARLMERIGRVTAAEVAATGIDWVFAPTLAVVRDDRWGRSYEGYSEDPELVRVYAGAMIAGLQGDFGPGHVVATAKHFIGDGGTAGGEDRGDTRVSEEVLRSIHGAGYCAALAAGVQTVMASFSSWNGEQMHVNHYLLSEVLKQAMGFDGFVISDWNGIAQVPGCTNSSCPRAIEAGIDMVMVPLREDWLAFIHNTRRQVLDGAIPMRRIDDAVSRILRVKMRAGLFDKPRPSRRPLANEERELGSKPHRALAREAVRDSLVLLKNKDGILPLSRNARVLVAGKSADSLANQTGGWTLTWQGADNGNGDFPGATSIWQGIRVAASHAVLSAHGSGSEADPRLHDAAIVVIGETPYAEGEGDIGPNQTLEHARLHPEDLAVIQRIVDKGVPVVTIFVSGRPLYVNKELNRSAAFVAAWLPGSEGAGIADLIFASRPGDEPGAGMSRARYDFTGKLAYSWPAAPCQTPINRGDAHYRPLFPYGYGLSYADRDTLGDRLEETSQDSGCDSGT